MPKVRIHKFLAHAGIASRRKSEELVESGRVTINGKTASIGDTIDTSSAIVNVDGKRVTLPDFKYYILNKPSGYVSTTSDPHGRRTVLDLVPKEIKKSRLYPVGRLDYDSEGLIILTNDGDFTNTLTHPSYGIDKTYEVLVRGNPSATRIEELERGVFLEDGKTAPAKIIRREIKENSNNWITITIHEGKKRQVRRMFEHIGHPVQRLIRVRIGWIELGDLGQGKYRELSKGESDRISVMKGSV